MNIYNSLTGKIEKFIPNEKGKVKLYTCGPTVYNYAHIGNLRSYIMEDILEKTLVYLGYDVKRAMNITDVGHLQSDADTGEDKMLLGAEREHKSVLEIADFYTLAFKKDFEKLELKWPEIVIPATQCIDVYIEIITKLLDKGYAYKSGGNIYFDTSKLKKYYIFSEQKSEDLKVGVREGVEADLNKKNPQDFVLWFTKSKFDNQALKWDSPWGVGYPGWHIECSGINYKYLGEYLDIHCGGIDNKFPHHTNEVAQSEAFLGHKWCNYWFHVAHLNLLNSKMSKSSGNFITLDKLIDMGYLPEEYKLFCLQSHYRKTLVFSEEAMNSAKNAYRSIGKMISKLDVNDKNINYDIVKKYQELMKKYLSDDLNTSNAITLLFDVLKMNINDGTKLFIVQDFDNILGLKLDCFIKKMTKEEMVNDELNKLIKEKISLRNDAKAKKNYVVADNIRDDLIDKGIILVDTPNGTVWHIDNVQKRKK
jgi:cysteinyl-tRNA synthetase